MEKKEEIRFAIERERKILDELMRAGADYNSVEKQSRKVDDLIDQFYIGQEKDDFHTRIWKQVLEH